MMMMMMMMMMMLMIPPVCPSAVRCGDGAAPAAEQTIQLGAIVKPKDVTGTEKTK